jgi:hypothetical protein
MKDGRTHLAHTAEHAVDLDTGAIVAVTIQGADVGDTQTLPETLAAEVQQLDQVTDADGEPVAVREERAWCSTRTGANETQHHRDDLVRLSRRHDGSRHFLRVTSSRLKQVFHAARAAS